MSIKGIPNCDICLDELTYPVKLECKHIVDLDCIGSWFEKNRTCPMDMKPIDPTKVIYCPKIIDEASVKMHFLVDKRTIVIDVNTNSSVHRLKCIISKTVKANVSDPVIANFSPKDPIHSERRLFFRLKEQKLALYSDTRLSDYEWIIGKTYDVFVQTKPAWTSPCDRCFEKSEKTCSHSDEKV